MLSKEHLIIYTLFFSLITINTLILLTFKPFGTQNLNLPSKRSSAWNEMKSVEFRSAIIYQSDLKSTCSTRGVKTNQIMTNKL